MDNDKKYLNIPIPMIQDLHINSKRFFNNVFDVGIYGYSKSLTGSEEKRYKDSLHFFGITQASAKAHIMATTTQFYIINQYQLKLDKWQQK